jgi:hypothetical protein
MRNKLIATALFSGILLQSAFGSQCKAQQAAEPDTEISAGLDLTSRYLWRGLVLSPGVSVQPFMEISGKGFTAGAWGSSTLHPHEWQEIDLYLSYEWNYLKFSLFDYFYFNDQDPTPHFFDYRGNNTGHVLECKAAFTGTEKIPFRFLSAYNFYGNDPDRSFYFEIAWMRNISDIDFELFCGYTPNAGFYHESRKGFTNIGVCMVRNLIINEQIRMPLQIQLVYNPLVYKTFMVVTIGIN